MRRTLMEEEHEAFRDAFGRFLDKEVVPHHQEWEKAKLVPREIWAKAGANGFLCMSVPAEYGGGGTHDFRYLAVIDEEIARRGASGLGFGLHTGIVAPYITAYATEEQKQRWLPGMVAGTTISAIAMTEPSTGSDLAGIKTTAVRDGDHYIVNGSKTFITNGINSDLVIVVVKTNPDETHAGMSLLVLERGMEGFTRGRNLDKVGMHAQDTAELFFADVRVPVDNLIGEEGKGFVYLVEKLAQERLIVALAAATGMEAAVDLTLEYVTSRTAFGKPIGKFQNTRFTLAEMKTTAAVVRTYIDACIEAHNIGEFTVEDAAMAKWYATDKLMEVVDQGVQMHGGYGYMREYAIARAWTDARVQSIYAGTNEIMKEIIGRGMGL